jgi:hypothetical protein
MADIRLIWHLFGIMNTTLVYLLIIAGLIMIAGGVIAFVALRNAPEGFEDETGFVGATKGDEALLDEFAAQRRYAAMHSHTGMAA